MIRRRRKDVKVNGERWVKKGDKEAWRKGDDEEQSEGRLFY